jgi:hypothetical protein
MSTDAKVLALLKQAEALIESSEVTAPTPFGPATLLSDTTPPSPFPGSGPHTLIFQPTAGGANLTLTVYDVPNDARGKSLLVVGEIFTFGYTQTANGDVISNLTASAHSFTGILVGVPSGATAPFGYTLIPLSGGNPLTLNLASPATALTQYKPYSVVYTTATENGSGYDQATFTPAG